jgi:hypothetical protein
MRYAIFSCAFIFAVCLSATGSLSSKLCSCAADAAALRDYDSLPTDRFFPSPEVTSIVRDRAHETIHLSLTVVGDKRGDFRKQDLYSLNGGKSWVRAATRQVKFTEVSLSSTIYRLPLKGTGLERSQDGGQHWRQSLLRVNGLSSQQFVLEKSGVSFSGFQLSLAAIHPRNPSTVFACLMVLPKLDSKGLPVAQAQYLPGIYASYDGGDNWKLFSTELRGASLEGNCRLGIDPSNPDIMLGHAPTGIVISRDGGKKWAAVGDSAKMEKPATVKGYAEERARLEAEGHKPGRVWPFDWTYLSVIEIYFDPSDDNVIYLVTNKGLYKTEDNAQSWCLLDTGTPILFDVEHVYIDPANSRRVFVGTSTRVLVSDDAGCHFRLFFDSERSS